MSVELRQTRLAKLAASQSQVPPRKPHKRRGTGVMTAEPKRERSSPELARRVDALSTDIEQIKAMLLRGLKTLLYKRRSR